MIILYILITFLLVLFIAWVLMIKPSGQKHTLESEIKKFDYAHRGLHSKKNHIPENSMAAFRIAIEGGYGIELDLHLNADGSLAVIHDTSLKRTAGVAVDITALTDKETKSYPLDSSTELIPFFDEVLVEVSGRVPLLVELKIDSNNHKEICDKTIKSLADYKGIYAIQSFDPRVVRYLRKRYPEVMRGQLAGYMRKNGDALKLFLDFGLRNLLTNFLTKPHFIAYRVQDTHSPSMALCRKLYKPFELNWTCRKKEQTDIARKNGAIPIFEGQGTPVK